MPYLLAKDKLFSKHATIVLSFIIACITILLCVMVHWQSQQAIERARVNFIELSNKNLIAVQRKIEDRFSRIYSNLRTLSKLPSIRNIDRHAENININDKIAIQEIYNNVSYLANVSEIYVLPEDFNPNAIDPVTGRPEEPILAYDEMIIGRALGKEISHKIKSQHEVEIFEYHAMVEQIKEMKRRYPTESSTDRLNIPAIHGKEVITCDNTYYSLDSPRDEDRMGMIYSVPYYGDDDVFKGIISAIYLTRTLRALLPEGEYALLPPQRDKSILAHDPQRYLVRSKDWIEKEQPNPDLIFSRVITLNVADIGGQWKLWVGSPNEHYSYSALTKEIKLNRNILVLLILLLAVTLIVLLVTVKRYSDKEHLRLIEEKDKAEREKRKNTSFLDSVLKSSGHLIISTDTNGVVTYINDTAERELGYTAAELVGKVTPALWHDAEEVQKRAEELSIEFGETIKPGFDVFIKVALRDGTETREWTFIRKDGTRFPVLLTATPMYEEINGINSIIGYLGSIIVITEQKKNEFKLLESEKRFRLIADSMPNLLWMSDDRGACVFFNKTWLDFTGRTMEQELGEGWADGVHPDDVLKCIMRYKHAVKYQLPFEMYYRLRRNDGEYRWFLDTGIPRYAENNVFDGFIGACTDITDRKVAEEQIETERQRLSNVIDATDIGTWEWNVQTGEVQFNERWAGIIGYTLSEISPLNFQTFVKFMHPEDLPIITAALQKHFDHEQDYYEAEGRMIHKNGSYVWVLFRGRVIKWSESGKPLFMTGTHLDITERKRNEAILQAANERLKRLSLVAEKTDTGVVICDVNKKITWVNQAYLSITGYALDEIIGKKPGDFLQGKDTDTNTIRFMHEKFDNAEPFEVEILNYNKQGRPYWVSIIQTPVFSDDGKLDGFVAVETDITNRKKYEETLALERNRLENIIAATEVGTWEWNVQTGETTFNERWANILGYELQELEPTSIETWIKLTHPDDLKVAQMILEKHFEKKADIYETEFRMQHKDGSWVWILDRGKVISWDSNGKPLIMTGTHLDITIRKQIENELELHRDNLQLLIEDQTRDIIEEKEKAEKANQAKSEFLSKMSHELRTPMHAILNYAQMGLKKVESHEDEVLKKFFNNIHTSGSRLLDLINNLLDLSKLESGKMEFQLIHGNIHDACQQALKELEPLILQRKLHIKLSGLDIAKKSPLSHDPERLIQVFINLISNAKKFSSEGTQIEIEYSLTCGLDEQGNTKNYLTFAIANEGVGIPEEELEKVFDKFTQSSRTKTSARGTGLGLSICKEIIEAHNGKIWAENWNYQKKGKNANTRSGIIFRFMLPITGTQQ